MVIFLLSKVHNSLICHLLEMTHLIFNRSYKSDRNFLELFPLCAALRLNISSLLKHLNELRVLIASVISIDVLAINETRLDSSITDS